MADVRVLSASDASCIIDIFRLLTGLAPQVIFSSVGSQNNSATCDEAADSPSPPIFCLFSSFFLFSMQRPTTLAKRNNNLHTHRGWENLPHSSHILQTVPACPLFHREIWKRVYSLPARYPSFIPASIYIPLIIFIFTSNIVY